MNVNELTKGMIVTEITKQSVSTWEYLGMEDGRYQFIGTSVGKYNPFASSLRVQYDAEHVGKLEILLVTDEEKEALNDQMMAQFRKAQRLSTDNWS